MGDDRAKPAFLITIDTEGDNLWARDGREITSATRGTSRVPTTVRAFRHEADVPHQLGNGDGSWLRRIAQDCLRRDTAEVGMHLHAWNSPPLVPLTDDDNQHHPYLIEYPENQIREKVRVMTEKLEDTFNTKMVSHRAGRWGFDEIYAKVLVEFGYQVDCSVMPRVSWAPYKGDPKGKGGPDFTRFPDSAYFLDLDDISRAGNSTLLEVPVSSLTPDYSPLVRFACSIIKRTHNLGFREFESSSPGPPNSCPMGATGGFCKPLLRPSFAINVITSRWRSTPPNSCPAAARRSRQTRALRNFTRILKRFSRRHARISRARL